MHIRDARPEDAAAACHVMRRSIAELCACDHRDDPQILARWLRNKTPETFVTWIRPGNTLLLAVEDDRVLAVGCVTDAGEITVNYVCPNARFRGVSSAMLAALEARAAAHGNRRCTLTSTQTAHRFYRARGYVETGPPERKFGTDAGFPMARALGA